MNSNTLLSNRASSFAFFECLSSLESVKTVVSPSVRSSHAETSVDFSSGVPCSYSTFSVDVFDSSNSVFIYPVYI